MQSDMSPYRIGRTIHSNAHRDPGLRENRLRMRSIKLRLTAFLLALTFLAGFAYAFDPAVVRGQITDNDSGTPIAGATVVISVNLQVNWVGQTNADGEFEIEVPLAASQSVVIEAGGPNHLPSRFNGTPDPPTCFFGCAGDGVVELEPGVVLEDINFALSAGGGRFAGSVVSANSAQPLAGIEVRPYRVTETGDLQFFNAPFAGISAVDGSYVMPLAMPSGRYHALARVPADAPQTHVATAFGNVACQFGACAIAATEPLELDEGELLPSIDFSLRPAASVSGELLPADALRLVSVYDGAGLMVTSVVVQAGTPGWTAGGLAGGSYYIELRSFDLNLQRQLHNGSACPLFGCERATGTPLEVPLGGNVSGINVTLQPAGFLSGTLVDAVTGLPPIPSGEGAVGNFNLVSADGTVAGGGVIQAQAGEVSFVTAGGVAPGQYFLRTYESFSGTALGDPNSPGGFEHLPGYADAAFPDVACAGLQCDFGQAQTVTIVAGEETQVTVALSSGSMISGSVLDDADGSGIGPAVVELVDAQNRRLATAVTASDGTFSFGAFPAGSYYLRTAMSSQRAIAFGPLQNAYFDRVLGKDELCSEQLCNPVAGTAVVLDGITNAGPFELRVESGPVIGGRIFDQTSGQLITRGRVEIRTSDDQLVGLYGIRSIDGRFQSTALPPDTYTLIPRVSPAFIPVTPPPAGPDGTASAVRQGSPGVQVTLGTESVDAELQVVDVGADRVFRSGFISLPFGQ